MVKLAAAVRLLLALGLGVRSTEAALRLGGAGQGRGFAAAAAAAASNIADLKGEAVNVAHKFADAAAAAIKGAEVVHKNATAAAIKGEVLDRLASSQGPQPDPWAFPSTSPSPSSSPSTSPSPSSSPSTSPSPSGSPAPASGPSSAPAPGPSSTPGPASPGPGPASPGPGPASPGPGPASPGPGPASPGPGPASPGPGPASPGPGPATPGPGPATPGPGKAPSPHKTPAPHKKPSPSKPDTKCVHFETGLCPGGSDCLCTLGDACTSPDAPEEKHLGFLSVASNHKRLWSRVNASGTCPGQCRKVVTGECPGDSSCLNDVGPCDPTPSPSSPPPGGQHPSGPDVSNWQGSVDWNSVKSSGAAFAFMKASEGTDVVDQTFATNWAQSRAAGIPVRGAYHFGHPGSSASAQAQLFVSTVGSVGPGELVVLDIETSDGVSAGAVASWCTEFLSQITSSFGLPASRVLVYVRLCSSFHCTIKGLRTTRC